MEYKIKNARIQMITVIAVALALTYFSIILGQQVERVLFGGLGLVPVLAYIAYRLYLKYNDLKMILYIQSSWGKSEERKRIFSNIRELFDVENIETQLFVDDQTWEDLNMDDVYKLMGSTMTTPGEQMLYDILRKPLIDSIQLSKRKDIINLLQENKELREQVQIHLYKLGRQMENLTLELLWQQDFYKSGVKILYNILACLPIISIVSFPLFHEGVIVLFILSFITNLFIHYKNRSIKGKTNAISYLSSIISAAQFIGKIENQKLSEYTTFLKQSAKKFAKLRKRASQIGGIEGLDVLTDYVKILFLYEERNYFNAIDDINANRDLLQKLYMVIGEIDALISVASYRAGLKEYTEPILSATCKTLTLEKVRHPLIEEPIPNNIDIKAGVILTGSNMSGKSTFLRTIGVNVLFAQTICTALAEKYEGSYFNIVTSISPGDNILGGKSYYLGEAEAILRIINSCGQDIPCLCIIDEIFRGTNPIERISASIEILKYLSEHNALIIVATHDLEITEMVTEFYECYYFTEDVDDVGLKFDYLIRKGVSPTRNAIKLLKFLGYPEEIVQNAYLNIDKVMKK